MKVWNSSWFSYNPGLYSGVTPGGVPALADSVDGTEGDTKTDAIPVLALRKGKYIFSATHASYATNFYSPHSSVMAPNGANIITSRTDHLARKETDLTAAYFITSNIALSMAFKHASEERDTMTGISPSQRLLTAKGNAVIFGALGSFPIAEGLSAYSRLGYGPTRLTTTLGDGSGEDTSTGRYLSSELAWMFHKLPPRLQLAVAGPRRQRLRYREQWLPYPIKRDISKAA